VSRQEAAAPLLAGDVYLIGCGSAAASAATTAEQASPQRMGFKAWNLLRMARLGLPVPPAFVLGTHYCTSGAVRALAVQPDTWQPALHQLEHRTGLALGSQRCPLLVSVRSGAPVSMPGMMETLLDIGLCDATVDGLLRQTGNPRLVWDAYRRLIATHAEVVAGQPAALFEAATAELFGTRDERDLDFAELRELTHRFLAVYLQAVGTPFPQDPRWQLTSAMEAVFASWQSEKAREYRRLNGISDAIGTAVTVQQMVYGNAGGQSGAGVGFTRDPATGEPALWVDFLFNAQGEDVVSGRRSAHGHEELAAVLPTVWQALVAAAHQLEHALLDMQDFEFTVQDGQLYLLQTRVGKRTPQAAARIALDLLDEKLITADEARQRTAGLDRAALTQARIVAASGAALAPLVPLVPLAKAATASSGVAIGEIALDPARAAVRHAAGAAVVLVRRDAETSDIAALASSVGLLTQRGARTSHAAVVARQLGKVCLIGCADLTIDEAARTLSVGATPLHEGDVITLDGNDGAVYAGAVKTELQCPEDLLARLVALKAALKGVQPRRRGGAPTNAPARCEK
jgi:pyruvate, orthophosphate dikinase